MKNNWFRDMMNSADMCIGGYISDDKVKDFLDNMDVFDKNTINQEDIVRKIDNMIIAHEGAIEALLELKEEIEYGN